MVLNGKKFNHENQSFLVWRFMDMLQMTIEKLKTRICFCESSAATTSSFLDSQSQDVTHQTESTKMQEEEEEEEVETQITSST